MIPLLLVAILAQDPAAPALDARRLAAVRDAIGGSDQAAAAPELQSAYHDLEGTHSPAYADPSDVQYLLALLEEPGDGKWTAAGMTHAEFVRVRALQALRCFPIVGEDVQRLTAILSRLLPDVPDPPEAEKARYAIALCREAAQVSQRPIRGATHDRVLRAFSSLSHCAEAGIRAECAEALGLWKDDAAVPLLEKLLEDGDVGVLRKACWAIGVYDASRAVDRLRQVAKETQDADTRVHAAYALARSGKVEGLETLIEALTDKERAEAIQLRLRELTPGPTAVIDGDIHQAWASWWTANRSQLRWDGDRRMFATE